MKLVLIESPYAANEDRGLTVETNLGYVRAAMRDCFTRGEAPYASHALYTQPGVLDDDAPDESEVGINAGLEWGKCADLTVVYTDLGITLGMRRGIERAKKEHRPVEERSLPEWAGR